MGDIKYWPTLMDVLASKDMAYQVAYVNNPYKNISEILQKEVNKMEQKNEDVKEEEVIRSFNDTPIKNPIDGDDFYMEYSAFWDVEMGDIGKRCHFEGEHGSVHFTIMPLPSCCGIYFLYEPYFSRKPGHALEDLYVEFNEFLDDHSLRNKLFISTTVEKYGNWHPFVDHCGWTPGPETFNGNSKNHVVLYEFSRTQLLGEDLEKVYIDEDDDS